MGKTATTILMNVLPGIYVNQIVQLAALMGLTITLVTALSVMMGRTVIITSMIAPAIRA